MMVNRGVESCPDSSKEQLQTAQRHIIAMWIVEGDTWHVCSSAGGRFSGA